MNFQLAIDGPSASGKSTISRMLAQRLSWIHIDTGALYRAIAYYSLQHNVNVLDETNFSFIATLDISYRDEKIYLNGSDISKFIRTHEISKIASDISKFPSVRNQLLDLQRRLARVGNVIMDGRDIGTVILPQANLKIFLTADISTRVKRRYLEDNTKPINEVEQEMIRRDDQDSSRKIAPLAVASDAIKIDTTNLNIEQVVNKIIELIKQKGAL